MTTDSARAEAPSVLGEDDVQGAALQMSAAGASPVSVNDAHEEPRVHSLLDLRRLAALRCFPGFGELLSAFPSRNPFGHVSGQARLNSRDSKLSLVQCPYLSSARSSALGGRHPRPQGGQTWLDTRPTSATRSSVWMSISTTSSRISAMRI